MAELKKPMRGYYCEVLGVNKECSFDEIRQAYKKLALKYHPDKLVQSGLSKQEATRKFQDLYEAYEVLSDPLMRVQYDSAPPEKSKSSKPYCFVPNLSPFFSRSAFSGYSSNSNSFYSVYSEVFNKVHTTETKFATPTMKEEEEAPTLRMGDLESPYAQVMAFYGYWTKFATSLDFQWADVFSAEAIKGQTNWVERQRMQMINSKARRTAQRRYNVTVRNLARVVKSRDKRVIDMAARKEEEATRREREKIERQIAAKVEDTVLCCLVCKKKFMSHNQWINHQQSNKHIHNYKLMAAC